MQGAGAFWSPSTCSTAVGVCGFRGGCGGRRVNRLGTRLANALCLGVVGARAPSFVSVELYEPSLKLRVMPDDWKWEEREKDRYRWREPGRGSGYLRQGVWIEIN